MKKVTIDAIRFPGSPEQFREKIRRILFIFFCAYMRRKEGTRMFAHDRTPIPLDTDKYLWFYGVGRFISDSCEYKIIDPLSHCMEFRDMRRGGTFLRVIMKPDGLYIFEFLV